MDRRFPVVLAVSTVFASCVAGLFYRVVTVAPRRAPIVTARPVVVASMTLPVGSMVRPSDLKLVDMPEASLPKNSFSRLEDVQGRPVIGKIFQDEPVLQDRLAALGSPFGLAPMIAPGQRAVGVRVNDVISVAGFVQPGMRVDVVMTGHPPGSQNSVTRTVLQNILVLSSGQILQPEPKGQAINAAVVTLQVDPREAEILILASAEGHIQLVMRNATDSRIESPKGTQLSSLYAVPANPAELPPPRRTTPRKMPAEPIPAAAASIEAPISLPALAPIVARTIEVIRAGKKSVDPVESPAALKRSLN